MKLLLDEMLSPAIARELRARGHDAEPVSSPPTPPTPRSRTSSRSTEMNGANGRPSAPSSRQPPISTRAPAPRDRSANSQTSRDFPTPASPPTITADGLPRPTSARALSSAESWPERPTGTGLDTRGFTPVSMPGTRAKAHARTGLADPELGTQPGGPRPDHLNEPADRLRQGRGGKPRPVRGDPDARHADVNSCRFRNVTDGTGTTRLAELVQRRSTRPMCITRTVSGVTS